MVHVPLGLGHGFQIGESDFLDIARCAQCGDRKRLRFATLKQACAVDAGQYAYAGRERAQRGIFSTVRADPLVENQLANGFCFYDVYGVTNRVRLIAIAKAIRGIARNLIAQALALCTIRHACRFPNSRPILICNRLLQRCVWLHDRDLTGRLARQDL